jgi:ATP-binding cassette subfamily B protein
MSAMNAEKTQSHSVIQFLTTFVITQWKPQLALLLCVIFIAAFGAIYPYFFKQLINEISQYQPNQRMQPLYLAAAAIVVVWGLSEMLLNVQDYIAIHVFPSFKTAIRQALLEQTIHRPLGSFSKDMTGGITSRIASAPENAANILSIFIFNFISTIITLASSFVLIFSVGFKYIFILIAWACIHLLIAYNYKNLIRSLCESHAKTRSQLSGTISDILINLPNIHVFCGWKNERDVFTNVQAIDSGQEKKTMKGFLGIKFYQSTSLIILFTAIVYSYMTDWSHHQISLGDITLIMMLTFNIIGCIRNVSGNFNSFIIDIASLTETLNYLFPIEASNVTKYSRFSYPSDSIDYDLKTRALIAPSKKIVFKNIYFRYPSAEPSSWILNDFSLAIEPGEHIGLVGLSGAGKTTLLKLLLGLYPLNQGEILIGEKNIESLSPSEHRDHISLVPQDPLFFHRSLADNIRYGKPDASHQDILDSLSLANCIEMIEKMPHHIDTLIYDAGCNFSRGQLQRIALARGMLRKSSIVLLDEPTASIDLINEKSINNAIQTLIEGKTAIIVAHRLETLRCMDRIIVLNNGKIAEQGDFDALLRLKGIFSNMWESRREAFEYD